MAIPDLDGKRTKIVATLGPGSTDPEIIRGMIRAGLDVARINFSHGDHEGHGKRIDTVRQIAKEERAVVGILCDIQGPKIRLGKVVAPIPVSAGDAVTFTLDEADGSNGVINLPHPEFMKDLHSGATLLYGDGEMEFTVVRKTNGGRNLDVEVVTDGEINSRKGIMAPNSRLTLSAITEKDRADIQYALSKDPEFMAMSFVRSPEDIRQLRWLVDYLGGDVHPAIIAKIEKFEALDVIEDIIEVTDGIMVARGDLGLEIPPQNVPFHQKRIIRLCNENGTPVITATQMLSSMEHSPRPTRAEASDVYNAIIDGTDAVMLSNETATGDYPVHAVETMADIARSAEPFIRKNRLQEVEPIAVLSREMTGAEQISDAVSTATTSLADSLETRAIVTATLSGYTARRVASDRPDVPILCVTPNEITFRRMSLVWGVTPMLIPQFRTIDEMIALIVKNARDKRYVKNDDRLIILAGTPFGIGGQTNFLKIHTVDPND